MNPDLMAQHRQADGHPPCVGRPIDQGVLDDIVAILVSCQGHAVGQDVAHNGLQHAGHVAVLHHALHHAAAVGVAAQVDHPVADSLHRTGGVTET